MNSKVVSTILFISLNVQMKALLMLTICSIPMVGQTWQQLTHQPHMLPTTCLLLRDGRVFCNQGNTGKWDFLTPDSTGSYINGTWTAAARMPDGYGPYEFSSAVLPDGRVLVEGGEVNLGVFDRTNLGAIYDPHADSWKMVQPPAGWLNIGDTASVVLPNGVYYQANHETNQTALFNAKDLTWTAGPPTKVRAADEAGWSLLQNGLVVTVDGYPTCGSNMSSEFYDWRTNTWMCGPQLPQQLWGDEHEVGAVIQLLDGRALVLGEANSSTALYSPATNLWTTGPSMPAGFNQDDGPTAVMPNGKVLMMLQLGDVHVSEFAEYDPVSNTIYTIPGAPNPNPNPNQSTLDGRLLILPTGQVFYSDFYAKTYVYIPSPGIVSSAAPKIISSGMSVRSGSLNNVLFGIQLNGLTPANLFGDGVQTTTNYPLVQFLDSLGHIWYANTHDDSYSGIAPNTISYTKFDVPLLSSGTYYIRVVTNGIASTPTLLQVTQ